MEDKSFERPIRKQYLDVLRAFATIGVIFIHVSANNWYGYIGSNDWISLSIYYHETYGFYILQWVVIYAIINLLQKGYNYLS